MQPPQPAPPRPHILTWLVAFGLVVLLVWQLSLAEQIKHLKQDRDYLKTKLESSNQQLVELGETLKTVELSPSSTAISPSRLSQATETRIADLEQRLNGFLSRADTARARAGFDYTGSNLTLNAPPPDTEPGKRAWGEEQATGAPNTPNASDASTAWASKEPDAGHEWLAVSFARPVDIAEVRVRESYNPGAITKVVALVNNQEMLLWEGKANISAAPRDFVVPVTTSIQSSTIHIHLDTAKISGWNEIDAVELIGKDGSRQWAATAAASSTYAAASNP